MTTPALATAVAVPRCLWVVGGAPEVTPELAGMPLRRGSPDSVADGSRPTGLIFDVRSTLLADLILLRARDELLTVPLLLLSSTPVADSTIAALGADDVLVLSSAADDVSRLDAASKVRVGLAHLLSRPPDALPPPSSREGGRGRADLRSNDSLLHALDIGIIRCAEDGVVTFMNRTAASLLNRVEAVGALVQDVLELSSRPDLILGAGSRVCVTYPFTGNGVDRELELTITRDEGRDCQGLFFIFRDVREEKAREVERARFERLAAMGTMVAGFAHEVRNPVAALRSLVEELVEELGSTGTGPHLGLMLQMIERIERLVRTSLQFGRPAAPKRAPARAAAIVSAAVAEMRSRVGRKGEEFRVRVAPDLPDVLVDERQIVQALVIFLHNALDATERASEVQIRVHRGPSESERGRKSDPPLRPTIRFEVIDKGPGISAEIRDRIFDPFFTTKPLGTGLGLSIAQQLVMENGARLEVSSQAGSTTFSIVIYES